MEAAFAEADKIFDEEFETGYQEHAYLETQVMTAEPEPDGRMLVHGSSQCVYYIHRALQRVLGCGEDGVRVRQDATGGAFGGKEDYPSILGCQAAVAAHLVSTIALIIVALSGLGNFTIPDYSTQICVAYYRIALCVAAALGGFVGLGTVTLFTIAGLCSVKSFGVPMLAPFAPKTRRVRPFLRRGKAPQNVGPQDMLNAEGRL